MGLFFMYTDVSFSYVFADWYYRRESFFSSIATRSTTWTGNLNGWLGDDQDKMSGASCVSVFV